MVRKLFKHEFAALFRVLLVVDAIVLGVGILARVLLCFEQDTTWFHIVCAMTMIAFFIVLIGGPIAAFVLSIVRFYKNMYTGEGYLTFTLPVTPEQHLWVKATTAIAVQLLAVLVSIVSFCIAFSGETMAEICQVIGELFHSLFLYLDTTHLIFYFLELAIWILVTLFSGHFLYYARISLGQTARKNRVLCAVAFYFAYYIITQMLGTALIIVLGIVGNTTFFDNVIHFLEVYPYESVHILLVGLIVLTGFMALLFFSINRFVMRKRLNLE